MKKISVTAFFWLLISCAIIPSIAQAQSTAIQSDPVKLLQYIADNMLDQLKAKKATLKGNPQVVYGLARRYVVPYADLDYMSRRVLPPRVWRGATQSQRSKFQKEFTTLLIRTYASALSSYKDQSVKIYPVRGGYSGKRTIRVNSRITSSSSSPINVSYRLIKNGNVWRLYDMSVEGVSMLQSFRSQFADILSRGDMEQLIQRLDKHNDR